MNLFACALLALCPQDPGQGLRQYQAGDFAAAAEAFRAATAARPDAADLWYDLALSEWRAGKLAAAEDAAERYASTPGGGRVDLHRGLLGNIRYSEAAALGQQAEAPPQPPQTQPQAAAGAAPPPPADPVALLEQAVAKAKAARDEFVRAAAAPTAGAEVARNTERSLKLLADLEKKLEEAKKRRDEQQKQDQKNDQKDKNDKNDKDEKNDKSDKDQDNKDKQDQQQKDQKKQNDQQQQQQQDQKDKDQQDQQPKDGEARPEPKQPDPKEQKEKPQAQQAPQQDKQQDQQQKDQQQQQQQEPQPKEGEARPEPKPEDGKDKQKPASQPRSDAPGEQLQATELTPEQKARLLEELQKLDGELRKFRAAARVGKKPVERDW